MASKHYGVKTSKTSGQTALYHFLYVSGAGKFSSREDVVFTEHGIFNSVGGGAGALPAWASTPAEFWEASDKFERKNGTTYVEHVIGLHHELSLKENIALIHDHMAEVGRRWDALCKANPKAKWAKERVSFDGLFYQMGIHLVEKAKDGKHERKAWKDRGPAKLPDGLAIEDFANWPDNVRSRYNLHVHLMVSTRFLADGIERGAKQTFARHNPAKPEKGGCKKASVRAVKFMNTFMRDVWQETSNRAFAARGLEVRIDMRSLKEQGLDREAAPRLPVGVYEVERKRQEAIARGERPRAPEHPLVTKRREIEQRNRRIPKLEREVRDRAPRLRDLESRRDRMKPFRNGELRMEAAKSRLPKAFREGLEIVREAQVAEWRSEVEYQFKESGPDAYGDRVFRHKADVISPDGEVLRKAGDVAFTARKGGDIEFANKVVLDREVRAAAYDTAAQGHECVRLKGMAGQREAMARELGYFGVEAKGVSERLACREGRNEAWSEIKAMAAERNRDDPEEKVSRVRSYGRDYFS